MSEKLVWLVRKCLWLDKRFYKYFFHSKLIAFLDDFNKQLCGRKNFRLKRPVQFIIARVFAHIEPRLVDEHILPTVVSYLLEALLEDSLEMTQFERCP